MVLAPLVVVALALCRYTVRDLGFVDLAGPTYSFARVGSGELVPEVDERPRDTGLAFAALPAGAGADPRVVAAGEDGGWVLHREGLLPLRIAELASARQGLDLLSAQLRRPIVRPLAELRLTRERRAEERVLLWALGLAAQESRAAVAIVYGRGRLAGEVLVGDAIERGELLAQLALVGESGECDTDRDGLGAPSLSLAWTAELRARAERRLDPLLLAGLLCFVAVLAGAVLAARSAR